LGFSAETGELSDNHDIISVSTKNLYDTKGRDSTTSKPGNKGASKGSERYKAKKERGSWSWFFFKVLMFLMVAGCGYVGFTAWRTQKARSHRF
jgi:mannose-binding lectin 2